MSSEIERPTTRTELNRPLAGLEEVEQNNRPPFILNHAEIRLLLIAGVGFFLDAYDLFIINQVALMLQYRYYDGHSLPSNLEGFIKAGANIGAVVGQFLFGYLADSLGRKAVYGKELLLIIFATIMCISVPSYLGGHGQCNLFDIHSVRSIDAAYTKAPSFGSACSVSFLVSALEEYPMSAAVTGDRASLRKRGTMLIYVFANQGWGSFVGSLITMIILACFKTGIDTHGHTNQVDAVWRIIVGLSLIPAFCTLYQRFVMPESDRFNKTRSPEVDESQKDDAEKKETQIKDRVQSKSPSDRSSVSAPQAQIAEVKKKAQIREFLLYISEWHHARMLIGTALSWFLVDIAFYGINLNTNVVPQQIGFDGSGNNTWHKLFRIATGNLVITALGFVPGYYVSVLTVEYLGRKFIQIMGFVMSSLFIAILAGKFYTLSPAAFIICFAFMQLFFNFGANTTTYMYPAELFPTRYRAFAHGVSAAFGKAGAIISSLAFNSLSKDIGTPAVLWIFVGCNLLGALITLVCLPEVKGRDPDVIELEERRIAMENSQARL
ncbi:hypothetical protein RSAG8_11103, partial [Rhizoctonia solani AG-8 WAC10335]